MKKDQLIKKVATKLKISQAKAAEAVKIICGSNVITNQQQIKVVTIEKKVPVPVIKEVVKIVTVEGAKPAAKKVVRKAAPKRKKATAKKVVKKATPKRKVTAKKVVKKAAPKRKKATAKKVVKKAAPKRKVTAKKVVKKAAPKRKVTAKKVVKKAAPKRKVTAKKVVKKAAPKRKVTTPRKVDPKFAKFKINNFQIIEGIGPKIEQLLHRAKIKNWNELSKTSPTVLKKILATAGNRYQMHDPSTWNKQAKLAQTGAWKELIKLQKVLDAGKNNSKNRRSPSKVERMAK